MKTEESEEIGRRSKLIIVTIVIIVIIISISAGAFYFRNDSTGDINDNLMDGDTNGTQSDENMSDEEGIYTIYASEPYGLSFPYPSSWNLDTRVYSNALRISIVENTSPRDPRAKVVVYADPVASFPFDNIENQVTNFIENDENLSIIGEVERFNVNAKEGLDFSYLISEKKYNIRHRSWILKSENYQYDVNYEAREKFYENSHELLDSIIENFELI